MKNIIDTYGFRIVQDSIRLYKKLTKHGFTFDDLQQHVASMNEIAPPKLSTKNQAPPTVKPEIIKPGDLTQMAGVVCCECQGKIYITAVCCSNPLKRQGFTRKGICAECGNEFGIR